jgi:ATP-dependent RNA helicase DHX57
MVRAHHLLLFGLIERVAAERCEKIGNTVGYAIRGETKVSPDTRLQFVTTGVLLRRIHSDPTLESISHVLIDEVHERSGKTAYRSTGIWNYPSPQFYFLVDSDFLLVILRQLIQKRPDIKIVLMSATINQELFSGKKHILNNCERNVLTHAFIDYFGGAPAVEIPGFTHPVEDL